MSLLDQFKFSSVPGAFTRNSQPGDAAHGRVTEVTVQQAMSYVPPGSNEQSVPQTHPDGKPKQQYVITIDTGVTGPEDDGLRRIYVKMWYKSDREALIAAVTAAGDDDVQVGGQFAAQYVGPGVDANGREAAWKVYKYEYKKPSALAGITGAPATPPTPAPVTPPPAPAAATPPPPPAPPAAPALLLQPDVIISYMAAGWSDEQLTAASNAGQLPAKAPAAAALAAIRNQAVQAGTLTA